jgi:hypothetical protein
VSFDPATLAELVATARDTARDAIVDATAQPDADPPVEGVPPSFVFTDVTATFRHPALVCDDGALVAWVADSQPSPLSARSGCLTLIEWPIHVRYWRCFPNMGDDGVPPVDARQEVAELLLVIVPAVQSSLAALVCDQQWKRRGVAKLAVDRGASVRPAAGSTGWEWVLRATL